MFFCWIFLFRFYVTQICSACSIYSEEPSFRRLKKRPAAYRSPVSMYHPFLSLSMVSTKNDHIYGSPHFLSSLMNCSTHSLLKQQGQDVRLLSIRVLLHFFWIHGAPVCGSFSKDDYQVWASLYRVRTIN